MLRAEKLTLNADVELGWSRSEDRFVGADVLAFSQVHNRNDGIDRSNLGELFSLTNTGYIIVPIDIQRLTRHGASVQC